MIIFTSLLPFQEVEGGAGDAAVRETPAAAATSRPVLKRKQVSVCPMTTHWYYVAGIR